MIGAVDIWKSFGAQDLFKGANFRANPGERIAVVGPNGSGKTTLFDILAGEETPDRGAVSLENGIIVGYLRQETDSLRGRSLLDEVERGRADIAQYGAEIHTLEKRIAMATGPEREALLDRYGVLRHTFEGLGGYAVEHEAKRILGGLGFKEDDHNRPTEEFSGGWLMRIALAKLLLARPELLLLDEPTNHLDLASVEWLEKFLASYGGTVIFTSHDREFINGFARKVIEVREFRLFEFTGNYDDFVGQRELSQRQATQAATQQARKIEAATKFIERFRYKKTKARQVQSRIKMLDKMERVEVAKPTRRAMGLRFPSPPRLGRVGLSLSDIVFGYQPGNSVFNGLDLVIEGNWKVALVGPNGAGKTTLLKLIAGVLDPQEGLRTPGHNASIGYFAQHQIEALDDTNTVLEELETVLPPGGDFRARDLLGRFLFSGDSVTKRVSVLSGGERTRLAMAKLLASPKNLLCLDEPTNHLDMQSRDVIGDALTEFPGAFVLITHDRNLIREVANRIVRVVAGQITIYDGDYDYYLECLEREERRRSVETKSEPKSDGPRQQRSVRRSQEIRSRVVARKLKSRLNEIERELDKVSSEVSELSRLLSDPQTYAPDGGGDPTELARLYEQGTARVRDLEAQWDALSEKLQD